MASVYMKTCPDCGAENDSNDLFCKECGTSLASVANTSQHTAAFTPIDVGSETQTTTIAPAAPPPPVAEYQPTHFPEQGPGDYTPLPEPESARGAVLGWLAATLMLIIIAAFIWSSVITEATRDRITGIF